MQTVNDFVRALSKKRCFRTSSQSQHVKGSQALVKSTWEHFYHIFWSLWEELIWQMFPLLKFDILRYFVTHWLLMTSVLFGIVKMCRSLLKGNYLKNEKLLLNVLFLLWNLPQILNIFKKKKIVMAKLFSNLQNVRNLVRGVSKNRYSQKFFWESTC